MVTLTSIDTRIAIRELAPFIDGEFISASGPTKDVIDPANGMTLGTSRQAAQSDVDQAVASAADTFRTSWRAVTPAERGRRLLAVSALIRQRAESLAVAETLDTGKPISQARADAETAARYFEYYAGVADKIEGTTIPLPSGQLAFTTREPLGVVAHITPWNSPLAQMARGVAPSLAAGNTVVVKPSEITPISTLMIAVLIVEAGVPRGACNVVVGGGAIGAALAAHSGVEHVTFTGSVSTGTKVAIAAAARIVGSTLELGGKSATIVFPDADLDAAAAAGANAVIRNSGQSCFATTRQIVHRSIYNEYVERTAGKMDGLSVGPGIDDPDLGPLVSAAQRSSVDSLVRRAKSDGAEVANRVDLSLTDRDGFFYPPILLAGVTNDMHIAQTEVFGPVQTVIPFDDEEEAIQLANASEYGLAAGLFTRDISRAHRVATQLEAGQVQVNKYPVGGVEIPFGGYKASGLGREKGLVALAGYTQVKAVIISY
jgi:NAD-dependent aldehyde dehydrogenases